MARQAAAGQTVDLDISILDSAGELVDADALPSVSITDASGNIVRSTSSLDVLRFDTGKYRLSYQILSSATVGTWTDTWIAIVDGQSLSASLSFIVLANSSALHPAEAEIGDAPVISYSQEEILGINKLLACLKARLKNDLKSESVDAYGNTEYVDCSIFTDDELVWFLCCSLSEFNQTPHFTDFTFDMDVIHDRFAHVIVEGAFILATAAQMLIEAGREFTITDNGITMNPPPLSATLNNELSQFVTAHRETLKYIKTSIKPRPTGFGGFRVLAVSPNYLRLRHLRQRRII